MKKRKVSQQHPKDITSAAQITNAGSYYLLAPTHLEGKVESQSNLKDVVKSLLEHVRQQKITGTVKVQFLYSALNQSEQHLTLSIRKDQVRKVVFEKSKDISAIDAIAEVQKSTPRANIETTAKVERSADSVIPAVVPKAVESVTAVKSAPVEELQDSTRNIIRSVLNRSQNADLFIKNTDPSKVINVLDEQIDFDQDYAQSLSKGIVDCEAFDTAWSKMADRLSKRGFFCQTKAAQTCREAAMDTAQEVDAARSITVTA